MPSTEGGPRLAAPVDRSKAVVSVGLLLPAVGVGVALVALGLTGGLAPLGIVGLPDPGWLTRLGLPAVQVLRDLAAMVTVGALAMAAWCLPGKKSERGRGLSTTQSRLVGLAQATASAWAIADATLVVLVYSDVVGEPPGAPGFWNQALFFATGIELGQYLTWGTAAAVVVAVGCALVRTTGSLGFVTLVALAALWPMALTGHAVGTLGHDEAVNLQMLHLVGTAVWLGGLVGLVIARRFIDRADLVAVVRHYSTLAGTCLALVTLSGLLGAVLRLRQWDGFLSSYGVVLGLKLAAVTALAVAGWWQRTRLIAQLAAGCDRAFVRVVLLEVAVLAAAAGLGVALARTAPPPPPGSDQPLTTAQSLLGTDIPPPLDAARWFTGWSLDSLFGPLAVLAVVGYLAGVLRLRRRGDAWPVLRTLSWIVGCLLFLWATNGAPGTYGRVLFSMHMVQHMTIATAVPVFLVLGTPVTLALRALRRRTDGSMGAREWLLRLVHSWPLHVVGHPVVAAGLFITGIVGFYYSSAFETSLESHTAHILMVVHFLASGYLFAECIVGADPGLRRPPYPFRVLLVMVTFGFHALFSVSLMASTSVLAQTWYALVKPLWGESLADDQYLGASLGWGLGEYPLAVMAVALMISWAQADRRERRRFDRSEDRGGGSELATYNEHLMRLAATIPDNPERPRRLDALTQADPDPPSGTQREDDAG
ncbi:cytochrome c oxidase assembly protein [Nocardioides sp. ChNu-153]|uniref:cytochrome c oxidase assembly protein n=1 Tax=Nocardioides sp. ChNu-153 TaxID=2779364 RepID=UPI0026585E3C|nr:cytochrome c oxidase assembly protein [Nocardioides sp. ChNu-153]